VERSTTRRCGGGKLVKVTVRAQGRTIEDIRITGDFFTHPEGTIEALEGKLVGMGRGQIGGAVRGVLGGGNLVIGFNADELILMIEECLR